MLAHGEPRQPALRREIRVNAPSISGSQRPPFGATEVDTAFHGTQIKRLPAVRLITEANRWSNISENVKKMPSAGKDFYVSKRHDLTWRNFNCFIFFIRNSNDKAITSTSASC